MVILATQLWARRERGSVLDAMFMSATAHRRFTTMPMEDLTPGSRLTLMLLMLVGEAPARCLEGW